MFRLQHRTRCTQHKVYARIITFASYVIVILYCTCRTVSFQHAKTMWLRPRVHDYSGSHVPWAFKHLQTYIYIYISYIWDDIILLTISQRYHRPRSSSPTPRALLPFKRTRRPSERSERGKRYTYNASRSYTIVYSIHIHTIYSRYNVHNVYVCMCARAWGFW